MTDYDVVVVGGGHNGLVCATYLAQAGRRVLVVEANAQPGGGATTREFADGYSVSACAQWLTQLNPDVQHDLALERHGLVLAARDLDSIGLDAHGQHVTVLGASVDGPSLSAADKAAYQEFHRMSLKFSGLLAKAFKVRPPQLVDGNATDRLNLLKLGLGMKLMGKRDMREFLRLALSNMYDVMEERFDNELLKATLSFDGVLGAHMGPRSPNTVFSYLYRRVGDVYGFNGPAVVRGGMGAVANALSEAASSHQVVMRCGVAVRDIMVEAGRATGVRLEGGEEISAQQVVSNADPKTTFNQLVGLPNVETGLARRVHNMRMQGGAAKLHLALDGLPAFTGLSGDEAGHRLVIAPTMNYLEEAFNPAKYGEYSRAPALDISIPSVHDDSLAPAGKHVLSAIVQFAPYHLKAGWESEKDTFKALVIGKIAEYAPGLEQLVTASELLTPLDLEREFHMTGGHWHHGEISLDQIMFMRPFPGATQYLTPIDGLYLCGAGTHPGGSVMGLGGRNAAHEIIKQGAAL